MKVRGKLSRRRTPFEFQTLDNTNGTLRHALEFSSWTSCFTNSHASAHKISRNLYKAMLIRQLHMVDILFAGCCCSLKNMLRM